MNITDKCLNGLETLGLTKVQSRLYLSVLKGGPNSFNAISKISGITRSEVYREMSKLENKGLIEKSLDRPIIIAPVNVKRALRNLYELKRSDANRLLTECEKAVEFLTEKINLNDKKFVSDSAFEFCLTSSKISAISKMAEMINCAKKNVYVRFKSRKLEAILFNIQEKVEASIKKGVVFKIIVMDNQANYKLPITESLSNLNDNFKISKSAEYRPGLIAVDEKQCLIETSDEDAFSDKPMLWTQNSLGVEFLLNDFKMNWSLCRNDAIFKNNNDRVSKDNVEFNECVSYPSK